MISVIRHNRNKTKGRALSLLADIIKYLENPRKLKIDY